MYRYLLITFFIITLHSCSEENVESECGQNYLHELIQGGRTTLLFYNSGGLLSTTVNTWDGSRQEFIYDDLNRLKAVTRAYGKTEFRYNGEGKLIATLVFLKGEVEPFDSLAITYDGLGRIVKREIHTDPSNNSYFKSYVSMSYPSDKIVKADFYNRDGVGFTYSNTFTYVLDGKSRPLPQEYYLYHLSMSNIFLSSNPTSLTITGSNPSPAINYVYEYNSAGYPIKESYDGYQYKYRCEPPRE